MCFPDDFHMSFIFSYGFTCLSHGFIYVPHVLHSYFSYKVVLQSCGVQSKPHEILSESIQILQKSWRCRTSNSLARAGGHHGKTTVYLTYGPKLDMHRHPVRGSLRVAFPVRGFCLGQNAGININRSRLQHMEVPKLVSEFFSGLVS